MGVASAFALGARAKAVAPPILRARRRLMSRYSLIGGSYVGSGAVKRNREISGRLCAPLVRGRLDRRSGTLPCASITMRGDGSVHCFQSSKELQEFFQGVGAGYDKEGNLGPGRYHSLTTQPIGARSLLATLTWQMVQKDGSVVREWRQSYNLVNTDGRWQILAAMLHLE